MIRITKDGLVSYNWNPETQSYPEKLITPESDVFACLREACTIGAGVTLGDIFRLVGGLPRLLDFMASYSWCRAIREFHDEALLPRPEKDDSVLKYLEISMGADLDSGDYEEGLDFYGVGEPDEQGATRYSVSLKPMNNLAHLPVMLKDTITIMKGMEVTVRAPYSFTLLQILDAIYDDISFHGSPEMVKAFGRTLADAMKTSKLARRSWFRGSRKSPRFSREKEGKLNKLLSYQNPREVAETAERIYGERYQSDFEKTHHGEFVAIDVNTGEAYLGQTGYEALEKANSAAPQGVFYLLRVGFAAAYCHY
jgi:hypothetical protein